MNKKNLMVRANDSAKTIAEAEVPAKMVELSEESLQQINGGGLIIPPGLPPELIPFYPIPKDIPMGWIGINPIVWAARQ